jgi:hypothetical protein
MECVELDQANPYAPNNATLAPILCAGIIAAFRLGSKTKLPARRGERLEAFLLRCIYQETS